MESETRTRKLETGVQARAGQTRKSPVETENRNLSGANPLKNLKPETGNWDGPGQSHESLARNWRPEIEKQAEQVQNRNLKPETRNQNPGNRTRSQPEACDREPSGVIQTGIRNRNLKSRLKPGSRTKVLPESRNQTLECGNRKLRSERSKSKLKSKTRNRNPGWCQAIERQANQKKKMGTRS